MAKITRYTGNLPAFGSTATGTNRTVFNDVTQSDVLDDNINASFQLGWEITGVNDAPTKQDFNGLGFTISQLHAYIHQMGIPEWDGAQEYHAGSKVSYNDNIWVCKTDTHVSATLPSADEANWGVYQLTSVKAFGATGDGSTDDYAAIAAAIVYLSSGVNGGGELFFPKGNYLASQTIYVPQSVTLLGEGRRPGPLGVGGNANIEGSCIIGEHTGAAVVSFKGSAFCGLRNICLHGDETTTPKTGLCVGRVATESSGRHDIQNSLIGGWFSEAAFYDIASEEGASYGLHILLLGGGAKYCYYTSDQDDLSVDALGSSSNFTKAHYGINWLHQGEANDSAAIYINARQGTQTVLFDGGFTGMTSGTTSSHVKINVVSDGDNLGDFTFRQIGHEAVSNASPPVEVFKVSTTGGTQLKGLNIEANTIGQIIGGTSEYIHVDDSLELVNPNIDNAIVGHPSSFSKILGGSIKLGQEEIEVRQTATRCNMQGSQVRYNGVPGGITNNIINCPVLNQVDFTGAGLNDLTIDSTTLFTGSVIRNVYVEIDGTGAPNSFRWSSDGGESFTASGVLITGGTQILGEGISVNFNATTGHTLNDAWEFEVEPFALPNTAGKFSGPVEINSGAGSIYGNDDDSFISISASQGLNASSLTMSGNNRAASLDGTSTFFNSRYFAVANSTGSVTQLLVDHLAGGVRSGRDNVDNLGSASFRWGTVFAGTGTINTSDEREKTEIQDIDELAIKAWSKVKFQKFKMKDAVKSKKDGARWHFGVIAQRVKEAFESVGLNPFEYGILCYDEWEDQEQPVYNINENGKRSEGDKVEIIIKKGSRYGIRYEEALVLECAYLRSLTEK